MQDPAVAVSAEPEPHAPSEPRLPDSRTASQVPDTQAVFASMDDVGDLAAAFPGTEAPNAGLMVPDSAPAESQGIPASHLEDSVKHEATGAAAHSRRLPQWMMSPQAPAASEAKAPSSSELPASSLKTWNRRPRQPQQQQQVRDHAADAKPMAEDVYELPASEPQKQAEPAAARGKAGSRAGSKAAQKGRGAARGRGRALRTSSRLAVASAAESDHGDSDDRPSPAPSAPAAGAQVKSKPQPRSKQTPEPDAVPRNEPEPEPEPAAAHEVSWTVLLECNSAMDFGIVLPLLLHQVRTCRSLQAYAMGRWS